MIIHSCEVGGAVLVLTSGVAVHSQDGDADGIRAAGTEHHLLIVFTSEVVVFLFAAVTDRHAAASTARLAASATHPAAMRAAHGRDCLALFLFLTEFPCKIYDRSTGRGGLQ